MKRILIYLFIFWLFYNQCFSYMMWLKSSDNTIENIKTIEENHDIFLPIVWFIFDPWWPKAINAIWNLSKELWNHRIYHITISPNSYNAYQVSQGIFDKNYLWFFEQIKKQDLKVIFRTMHEMNWGWYPWSSDTSNFKKAWIHIWYLSRQAWLDNHNILFDFSINHWDMPTNWTPNQNASLINCNPSNKIKLKCLSFEDYYPWDQYVDMVWVSFYNWWKWNSDRKWLTPTEILYDKEWETLHRLKSLHKPIFIDEVWTSAVNYEWTYEYTKTLQTFNNNRFDKNIWLWLLKDFLLQEKTIYGFVYFNVDYTDKLTNQIIWEADWAVINLKTWKVYEKIFDLYNFSDKNSLDNNIMKLFDIRVIKKYDKFVFINSWLKRHVDTITSLLDKKFNFHYQKINWLKNYKNQIQQNKKINTKIKQDLLIIIEKTIQLYTKAME